MPFSLILYLTLCHWADCGFFPQNALVDQKTVLSEDHTINLVLRILHNIYTLSLYDYVSSLRLFLGGCLIVLGTVQTYN